MTPCELTASITAFANAFASNLSNDELTLWSAIFCQLGETLETIAVQRELLNKSCKNINDE